MPTFLELSSKQLRAAIKLSERMELLQQRLHALRGSKQKGTGKHTMSPEGRAAIAAAQKARWAKINGKASPAKAAPKKKVMSPEAKAKIAAAMKARWAAMKKGEAV